MTPRTSLRWRLRDATAGAHARLDARLAPAFDDIDGYAAFLRGMQRFLRAACTAASGEPALVRSARALTRDLDDLALRPLAPADVVPHSAAAALGWRYVVAGASLGARVLLPRAQALGFDARHGARYLSAQASGTDWRSCLAMLDAAPIDAAEAACEGARRAFAVAEAGFLDALEAQPA